MKFSTITVAMLAGLVMAAPSANVDHSQPPTYQPEPPKYGPKPPHHPPHPKPTKTHPSYPSVTPYAWKRSVPVDETTNEVSTENHHPPKDGPKPPKYQPEPPKYSPTNSAPVKPYNTRAARMVKAPEVLVA